MVKIFARWPTEQGSLVTHSVERVTPGQKAVGSIPALGARSLLFGSVSV